MKKYVSVMILLVTWASPMSSQNVATFEYVPHIYTPLTEEQLRAQANLFAILEERGKERKKKFEEYQDEAYKRYSRQDWYGFLTYTNYALETGFYNTKMYFDRGVAYENLHDFKNAKKEYKKAKKEGYAYAEAALQALKIKEREYKRSMKRK